MAGPQKKDHDQKVRDWIDWYERNRRQNEKQFEYRLERYNARTQEQVEAERQRRRDRYAKLAKERIAAGWERPTAVNVPT